MNKNHFSRRITALLCSVAMLLSMTPAVSFADEPEVESAQNVPSLLAVANVTLSETAKTLTVGESFELTATVAPESEVPQSVAWTSADASVKVEQNGENPLAATVTALAATAGPVAVKVTADGIEASCAVTVVKKTPAVTAQCNPVEYGNGAVLNVTADVAGTFFYSVGPGPEQSEELPAGVQKEIVLSGLTKGEHSVSYRFVPANAVEYQELTGQSTTVNVTGKVLTVQSWTAAPKEYDGSTEFAVTDVTLCAEAPAAISVDPTAFFATAEDANAGEKTLTLALRDGATALTGTGAENYAVSLETAPTAQSTITPKEITAASYAIADKAYDGTTAIGADAVTVTWSGVVGGDSVSLTGATYTADLTEPAGGVGVTADLSGASLDNPNYALDKAGSAAAGTVNIVPKEITASYTGGAITKTSDGGTALTEGNKTAILSGITLNGVLDADKDQVNVQFDANAMPAYSSDSIFAEDNVITGVTLALDGTKANCYALANASGVTPEAAIDAAPVTAQTPLDLSGVPDGKVYLDETSSVELTFTAGQDVDNTYWYTSAPALNGASQTLYDEGGNVYSALPAQDGKNDVEPLFAQVDGIYYGPFSLTYRCDVTLPEIEVDSVEKPEFNNEELTYTITVKDENGSGVDAGSIQYAVNSDKDAAIQNWTPADAQDNGDRTYTFKVTVPAGSDGLGGYLSVKVADRVGHDNNRPHYRTLVLEKNAPNLSVTCDGASDPANTHTVRIAACDVCGELGSPHEHPVSPSSGGQYNYSGIATITYTLTKDGEEESAPVEVKGDNAPEALDKIPDQAFFETNEVLGESLNGSYTLKVTAADYCGNKTTETLTLVFDNTAPAVAVQMTQNVDKDGDGSYYYRADNGGLTVTFTDDNLSAGGEYKAVVTEDGIEEPNSIEKKLELTSGQTEGVLTFTASEIAGLGDGGIAVTVTATDAAGNEAEEMTVEGANASGMTAAFVLDKTAPVLTAVTSDGNGNFYGSEGKVYNKQDFTIQFTIDEQNFDENSVAVTTTPENPGASTTATTTSDGEKEPQHVVTLTVSGTADNAVHSPALSFADRAGNKLVIDPNLTFDLSPRDETTVSDGTAAMANKFVLDTTKPRAEITYTELDAAHFYADGDVTNAYYNREFTASFAFSDEGSELDPARLHAEQTGAAEEEAVLRQGEQGEVTASLTVEYAENVENNVYAFVAYGTDKAGNPLVVTEYDTAGPDETTEYTADSVYTSAACKVLDTAAPTYTMTIDDPDEDSAVDGMRAYYNDDIAVEAAVSDANIDSKKVELNAVALTGEGFHYDEADVEWKDVTLGQAEAVEQFDGNVCLLTATADADGVYRFQINGEDRAGNPLVKSVEEAAKEDHQSTEASSRPGEFRSQAKVRDTVAPQLDVSLSDSVEFYAAHLGDPATQTNNSYSVTVNQPYRGASSATGTLTRTDRSPTTVTYVIESTVQRQSLTNSAYGRDPLKLTINGPQIFYLSELSIRDRAGNVSSLNGSTTKIYLDTEAPNVDEFAPTVALTSQTSAAGRGEAGTDLYNSDVTVRATVTDPGEGVRASGLYRVYYQVLVNGEDWTGRVAVSPAAGGKLSDGSIGYGTSGSGGDVDADEKITLSDTIDFTFDDATFNYNDVRLIVWAEDNSGNLIAQENYSRYTFAIDITAPTIRVTYDNNDAQNDKYFKADRTATIVVTERNFDPENTVIRTQSTAVSGWTYAAGELANGDADTWTCTVTYAQDGDYTFDVTTTDLAGHQSAAADYGDSVAPTEFTIDKTAPVIAITFDNNNVLNGKYYDAARVASVSIEEHNFSEEGVELTTTASIQEGTVAAPGAGAWGGTGDTHVAQVNFSADGNYTMRVEYVDLAGNEAVVQEVGEFVVDTTAPVLEITGVENQMAYNGDVAPVITYHDINYDASSAGVSIRGYQRPNGENLNGVRAEDAFGGSFVCNNIEPVKENDDVYTATGTVRDLAGNETTVTVVFSVNRFGSTYVFSAETEDLLEQYYTNEPQALHVTEINVDGLESHRVTASLNGELETLEEGSGYTMAESVPGWHQFDYTIAADNFTAEGAYDVTLYSEDAAGNASSNRAVKENGAVTTDMPINFVMDVTAPVNFVTGVDEGEQYVDVSRTVIVNYDDNTGVQSLTLYLNGEVAAEYDAETLQTAGGSVEFTASASNRWQQLEVVSVDFAGNESEKTSVRYLLTDNLFVQYYNNTPLLIGSLVGLAAAAALVVILIRRRRNRGVTQTETTAAQ